MVRLERGSEGDHDGCIHRVHLPTAKSNSFGIAAGPERDLWFTEGNGNGVTKVGIGNFPSTTKVPSTTKISPTAVPSAVVAPAVVAQTQYTRWWNARLDVSLSDAPMVVMLSSGRLFCG